MDMVFVDMAFMTWFHGPMRTTTCILYSI